MVLPASDGSDVNDTAGPASASQGMLMDIDYEDDVDLDFDAPLKAPDPPPRSSSVASKSSPGRRKTPPLDTITTTLTPPPDRNSHRRNGSGTENCSSPRSASSASRRMQTWSRLRAPNRSKSPKVLSKGPTASTDTLMSSAEAIPSQNSQQQQPPPQSQNQRQSPHRRILDRRSFLRKGPPKQTSPSAGSAGSHKQSQSQTQGHSQSANHAPMSPNSESHISNPNATSASDRFLTYEDSSESDNSSYVPGSSPDDTSYMDNEEAMLITGREDTKRAAILRIIVFILFIAMAVGAPILSFRAIRDSQWEQLEEHFQSNLYLDKFMIHSQQWESALQAFVSSIAASNTAPPNNTSWPFHIVPNIGIPAQQMYRQFPFISTSILPIVATSISQQQQQWEEYSNAHISELMFPYEQWYSHRISPFDEIQQTTIWNQNSDIETTIDGSDDILLLPTWQTAPPLMSNLNLNAVSISHQTDILLSMTDSKPSTTMMTSILSQDFVTDYYRHLQFVVETSKTTPMLAIQTSIFDSLLQQNDNNQQVAILSTTVSLQELLSHMMTKTQHTDDDPPIMLIISNTCNDVVSFKVQSSKIEFLGYQDMHHNKFNGMEDTMTWDFLSSTAATDSNNSPSCVYTITVYPTTEMEDRFTSDLPFNLAISLACLLVFISIMALSYDYFVQRRMWNAIKSARESRAIVSSLFPANVRDRLLEEEEHKIMMDEFNYVNPASATNIITQPLRRMSMSLLGTSNDVGDHHNNSNNNNSGTNNTPGSMERRKSMDQYVSMNSAHNNSNSSALNYNGSSNGRRRSNDSNSNNRRRSNDSNSNNRRRSNDSNSKQNRRRSNDSGYRSNSDSHPQQQQQQQQQYGTPTARRGSMDRDNLFLGVSDMLLSGAMAGFAALAPPKLRLKFVLHHQDTTGRQHQRDTAAAAAAGRCDDNMIDDDDELLLPDKPIADLFPNCTVLFCDISGFTAWSSEREPEQVFTLLQTIFQSFDILARRRNVYKVETIGDCYVAVTGCPDRQDDHALRMTKFARACMEKVNEVTKKLEVRLGPGTGELAMRFGLHSGPVTAGVLRGEKSRFQLFGDTVNTASRMESTGQRNRIQISQTTADLLVQAGKANWITERSEVVYAKGKGAIKTYWVLTVRGPKEESKRDVSIRKASVRPSLNNNNKMDDMSEDGSMISETGSVWGFDEVADDISESMHSQVSLRFGRWIDWQVDLLAKQLKQLVAGRTRDMLHPVEHPANVVTRGEALVDEVSESINMPQFDARAAKARARPSSVRLPDKVMAELREYVTRIAALYRDDNPFHNFAHASHVCMSASKLLSRIVKPEDVNYHRSSVKAIASDLHDYTYGITSDPLTHVAVMFSALIHDVDHVGVSNAQLGIENPDMAQKFKSRSVAEQNSIDIAWEMLMDSAFSNLQKCLFADESELIRFRQMVVNMVISTDIFDKAGKEKQKERWEKAFHPDNSDNDLKASIVMEAIIQAADVAHTMQHWQVYTKWNERLFCEMYKAYECGRATKDPSLGWYKGELWFFDNYIIPLARKLERCGIFGVSIDEFLQFATENRKEWAAKGESIVKDMVQRWNESKQTSTLESSSLLHKEQDVVVFGHNGDDASSSNKSTKASTDVEEDIVAIDMAPSLKSKSNLTEMPSHPAPDLEDDVSITFSDDSEEVEC